MKSEYRLYKNKNTLEVRRVFLTESGNILDVCRTPEYVYGKERSDLYERSHNITEASVYSEILNSDHLPTIDHLYVWDTLRSFKNDKKRSKTNVLHCTVFIMRGFGYDKRYVSNFFNVTDAAVDYMVRIVPVKMASDRNFKELVDSLPEDLKAYMNRINSDYMNAERTKSEINK